VSVRGSGGRAEAQNKLSSNEIKVGISWSSPDAGIIRSDPVQDDHTDRAGRRHT